MNNQLYMVGNVWMNRERMEKARGLGKHAKDKKIRDRHGVEVSTAANPVNVHGEEIKETEVGTFKTVAEFESEDTMEVSSRIVALGGTPDSNGDVTMQVVDAMTIEDLKKACNDRGIKYHHASGEKKLKELLGIN